MLRGETRNQRQLNHCLDEKKKGKKYYWRLFGIPITRFVLQKPKKKQKY